MEEIKQELRQENVAVKATAVAKLTYVIIFVKLYENKLNLYLYFVFFITVTNAGL